MTWQIGKGGRGKGGSKEVARWESWENGEVARWEVPGFIQEWGTQSES